MNYQRFHKLEYAEVIVNCIKRGVVFQKFNAKKILIVNVSFF